MFMYVQFMEDNHRFIYWTVFVFELSLWDKVVLPNGKCHSPLEYHLSRTVYFLFTNNHSVHKIHCKPETVRTLR